MRSLIALVLFANVAAAEGPDPSWLRWRNIGPFRGGRTRAVAGVVQEPNVFYMAPVNGGVWKTEDYGHTWTPIFDDQPTGSIGALAVAPSDPHVIYAGSGEGLHRPDLSVGDGIYRSRDGGKTWTHLGLRDAQQIAQIAVDPRDPRRLFVAAGGHPYGPNEERGIFRSTDGGDTFQKVLYRDADTGGCDVVIDPSNPKNVYAALAQTREGPWENASWDGAGGGIYRSSDGGTTWSRLTQGLPADAFEANLAIAPSRPARLIAAVGAKAGVKLYRSDDAGAHWATITEDARPASRIGGGDLPVPRIDPQKPDVVYVASTVSWKSTDGGKTWNALRGAPGGDDYQNIWIHPRDPAVMILGSDQGAVVTVNGGASWSEWYNQPTAQLYHVSADNAFPYRVCSGQQESGSVCIASRGNDGEITMRDWHPVAAEEYGYAVPDPLDADIVYGGKLTRYDRRNAQARDVSPRAFRGPDYRVVRTQPIVFAPTDPHTLYFASNRLWKTTNGGSSWDAISPDLSRKSFDVPATVGVYRGAQDAKPVQRGVIYAVAPSPIDGKRIWAGTDDGLIHVTTDGGRSWKDVTPSQLQPWQKVSILEASHTAARTAYAAINTLRLDDLRPHIYRTRDGGASWQEIVAGIPANENVDVVREDPVRPGLLFAGTERAVYVSFDDGDHWQPLRNNMPASSVRDLMVKGDDLVAATHGRGFWILDDLTALRQQPSGDATLFAPAVATRVRWNSNTDTPLPPDTPAGENPPDGAVLDYYLKAPARLVTLEIHDTAGALVRRYASDDPVPAPDPQLAIPRYWVQPPQVLATGAGMHRFVWDLHETPLPGAPQYPIAAVPHATAPAPTSPWALPGSYKVVLTVDGKRFEQKLVVRMDPRIRTRPDELLAQQRTARGVVADLRVLSPIVGAIAAMRDQLAARKSHGSADVDTKIDELAKKVDALSGASPAIGVSTVKNRLARLLSTIDHADAAPTAQHAAAAKELHSAIPALVATWQALVAHDLVELNTALRAAKLPEITVPSNAPASAAPGDDD
jgi:photosystem II stability/assembly factor-like uncharacterized protein